MISILTIIRVMMILSHNGAALLHSRPVCALQVSRRVLGLMGQVEDEPLLNLEQLNPGLLGHARPMAQVHQLRLALCSLGDYLSACRSVARKTLLARYP